MCEKGVFSVGIVCYRNFAYLKEAIHSVLQQDHKRIELIVSDDGSPDFPVTEVKNFIEKAKRQNIWRVEIRREPKNIGTVRHLNNVRNCCHGEFVTFLAGDDVLANSRVLSSYVHGFENAPEGCLIEMAQTGMYDTEMQVLSEYYLKKPIQEDIVATKTDSSALLKDLILFGPCLPSTSTCFRAEFFERFGDFDEAYTIIEDFPMHIRLAEEGWTIHYENFVAIKHRHGGISHGRNGATATSSNAYFCDLYRMINDLRIPYAALLESKEKKFFLRQVKQDLFWLERAIAKGNRNHLKWISLVLLHPVLSVRCILKKCEVYYYRVAALSKKLLLTLLFLTIFKNSIADIFFSLFAVDCKAVLTVLTMGVLGILVVCVLLWGALRVYRFPKGVIVITR